ncbi:MAG: hypothetical protein QM655_12675 [Nocardioidaceae bacterium]
MGKPEDPQEAAWSNERGRHREWWRMSQAERLRILSYEAGFDDGWLDGHLAGVSETLADLRAANAAGLLACRHDAEEIA